MQKRRAFVIYDYADRYVSGLTVQGGARFCIANYIRVDSREIDDAAFKFTTAF